MNILFVGDIVGRPGRECIRTLAPKLCAEFSVDFLVVNAENAAGGLGVTPEILDELLELGVQAITLGNHTWRKRALVSAIEKYDCVVRPANFSEGVPGKGATVVRHENGSSLGVLNLIGRVFMEPCMCPFRKAQDELARLREQTTTILVDFHAEATAEKVAMGWYLDGKCTAVVGTHTHVQTADERVLPGGTAYITDVGMTGPVDSVIGMERKRIIDRFLNGMPIEFRVARERPALCGVVIESDDSSGRAKSIRRVMAYAE